MARVQPAPKLAWKPAGIRTRMTSFHRRQLRRWAARVLLAWLFGVVAGVANACMLAQPTLTAPAHDGGHHAVAHDHQHQHAAPHDGDEVPNDGLAACHAFCEQSSVTVPSTSTTLDKSDLSAAALTVTLVPLPSIEGERPIDQQVRERRPGSPPIPIAFLRLAL